MKGIKLKVSRCLFLQPKNKRVFRVKQLGNVRRSFSVDEVTALVRTVELLRVRRWREVKLQAFSDADHRTPRDLKDKYNTLVHTVRISLEQRRGKSIPQELLDKVLIAHTLG
ncbi:hypothetical protein DEO72_LG1g13 [Vigna unguiculata]|uniref:HTH myb-type domain-containing protein n=1 Tax=Vigna unguiculata TaxID=3917 RepID=A0A4D6KRB4_VIGUN|nr:hypothetical protein DEO72_LG1g13 [Vigna unguiculata]